MLYNFCSVGGTKCTDGSHPNSLIQDAAGNLYGTTGSGGANNAGTVFKLDTAGHETVLYNFCSVGGTKCTDGSNPNSLIQDAAGNLYGTTRLGWANQDIGDATGGTVFQLTPVSLTTQTITFPNPGPLTYGVGSISLIAAASSGLPVGFAVTAASPAGIGAVSGDTLTITGAGSITVCASQSGNATYAPAQQVCDAVAVSPAPLTVTCNNVSLDFGWPIPVLTGKLTGEVAGDGITVTCSTTAAQGSPAGPYPITPALHDSNSRLSNYSVTSTNGTLTIGSAATSVPLMLSLSPGTATAGGATFPLTVNGANFDTGAVVLWNGSLRKTTYVSSTQLTAAILVADIAKEGTYLVTVANPAPNAATSAAQPFVVMSSTPVATITAVSISDAADGSGNHLLTLTGTDFVSNSMVNWDDGGLATTYVSPWQIIATLPAADFGPAATVKVANPSGTSASFELP